MNHQNPFLGSTSLSHADATFGAKMQPQGCMANSSLELCFSFNRRRRPKGHRQRSRSKPGRLHYIQTTACAIFAAKAPRLKARAKKIAFAGNCSKMQTTLVLAHLVGGL